MSAPSPSYDSITTQDSSGIRVFNPQAPVVDISTMFTANPTPPGQGTEVVEESIADNQRRHQTSNRIFLPPPSWLSMRLTAGSTSIPLQQILKSTPGTFHGLMVTDKGTNWVVTIADEWNSFETPKFVYKSAMGNGPFLLDLQMMRAITLQATGDAAGELVVMWL